MLQHSCHTCSGSRSRRALSELLRRLPNITTASAARKLDVNRPYIATLRTQMESAGCVTARTVDGRRQAHTEKAFREALTWSNTPPEMVRPLIPTLPGEAEYLLEAPKPRDALSRPVGIWWYGVTFP